MSHSSKHPTATPLIAVKDVSFCYGKHPVLEHIDLNITDGEFVGIIGPNGSGKSTLLKLMLGLLPAHEGKILLAGQPVTLGTYPIRIGYIPQKVTQNETRLPMTVYEMVSLGRVQPGMKFQYVNNQDHQEIRKALETVGMWEYQDRQLNTLSGGQQQRVFIAKSLASHPTLLMLDEPTVGVDAESETQFYQLLKDLNREHHLTIILVSHDLEVVTSSVTSLVCLNRQLLYEGSPKHFDATILTQTYGKERTLVAHHH